MADPRVSPNPTLRPTTLQAGIIKRIHLENFMCHTSLEIEFGDWINFITGQNGSGKSAILTALCVAFGSRARGTQRASTLKDFIKTGCSYALVQVDIKNEGEDAFKPELYGKVIIVERRISESASTITLKDSQGRRVGTKRDDLREVTEHFNIDVENPCVIMSQDKSREFLHSGNSKDKFKFFFKATLLQHVDDLLKGIEKQLNDAIALVDHLEKSLRPALKELDELQEKIKSMEHVEEMRAELQSVRRKLVWVMVHDAEKRLAEKRKEIEKLIGRKPSCQQRIDMEDQKVEDLSKKQATKKRQIAIMVEKTSEMRRMNDDLQQNYSTAKKEELELEGECEQTFRKIQAMVRKVEVLEKQIQDFHEQSIMETQAEENKLNEKIRELQVELDEAKANCQRLKIEEDEIAAKMLSIDNELENISKQVEDAERSHRNTSSRINNLRSDQTNKVTQFGGGKVTALLQAIEWHQNKFRKPPIGPIGAHVKLVNGDKWSIAVENAVGRLLNAFIVTDHKDSLTLRACAKEAKYNNLQIITYDFSIPRMKIPCEMLPQTHHPTVLSVLHSDNHTVLNVLIDVGSAERLVLVQDYDVGKSVVFEQKVANMKDAYTSDGSRMFIRGRSETILPPYQRYGRLSSSFSNQIKDLERKAFEEKENVERYRGVKRSKEDELRNLRDMINHTKRHRVNIERQLRPKEFELDEFKKSQSKLAAAEHSTDLDELSEQISMLRDEIQEKQIFLENIRGRLNEAQIKTKDANMMLGNMRESAKSDIEALSVAEKEMMMIEEELRVAEAKKEHYEGVMNNRVLPDINNAEAEYKELEKEHKESYQKAKEKCSEGEFEAVDERESTAEQLSVKVIKLDEKLKRESQRYQEPIEDLRMCLEKKQRKIFKKQQAYKSFREKLDVSEIALEERWRKFQRNAAQLAKQLTWDFNGHLKNKGVRGEVKVDYEQETLSIEVTMPQDATNSSTVRDTRGLSGGERSFSTLCFALTLHGMTEAPFRAMDEFDVFMDAVSRKISLDAVVDFALERGSQWIFITPHDISMVKHDERIKKQQMAAPRG